MSLLFFLLADTQISAGLRLVDISISLSPFCLSGLFFRMIITGDTGCLQKAFRKLLE